MKRILVVDDDGAHVLLVRRALRDTAEVISAASQAETAEKCAGRIPDLIFLDLRLGSDSGFSILRELRSRPQFETLPIIILSTSALDSDVFESYRLGGKLLYDEGAPAARFRAGNPFRGRFLPTRTINRCSSKDLP